MEWDVARHMKMGLGPKEIRPSYNPRPGQRYAVTYGRGLCFDLGNSDAISLSHLGEPCWVYADAITEDAAIEAQLTDTEPIAARTT